MDAINRWLQLGANIGILAGIVLVVVQINQNTQLVREQLYQSRWSDLFGYHAARMGENPAQVVQKALSSPTELSVAEHEVMDAYLHYQFYYAMRNYVLGQRGITDANTWRVMNDPAYAQYNSGNEYLFGSAYGKAWLAERARHAPESMAFWHAMGARGDALSGREAHGRIDFIRAQLAIGD